MPSPLAAAADAPRTSSFRAAPLRWLLRRLAWLLIATWTVLLIAWLTLHWGILPRVDAWRGTIEQQASRAIGVPVRIGAITVRSAGWVPAIELRDVALFGPDGRRALALPRVAAAISARSLLALELRFDQLLVEGAELDVRRDPLGRLLVAGLDLGGEGGGSGDAAEWFFRQREFVVLGGLLHWTDEQRLAPPLALRDVRLVVRNGLRQHNFRLDATPDAAWGDRFTMVGRFTQPLLARRSDWRRWQGSAFVELPRADLRELRHHVELPFELAEGNGAVRAWFDIADGRPRAATVDIALREVAMRLAADVEPLVVQRLEGRVAAERDTAGVSFAVSRLGFVTGDGVRWPEGKFALRLRQREGQPVEGGELSADRVDLGVVAQIAARLPIGDAAHRLLAELAPQGVMQAMRASWEGPADLPRRYRLQGHVGGLELAPRVSDRRGEVGRPGLRNASVQIDATEAGGEAKLSIVDGSVTLPGVFEEAEVPFARLSTQLKWKIEPVADRAPRVSVAAREVQFANPDIEGSLEANWSTGPGEGLARGGRFPGRIELDGRIGRGSALRVPRYLPLHLGKARIYLARAIGAGTVAGATFRVRGDLWDFPFFDAATTGRGEFRITARAEDMSFAYVPSIPEGRDEPAWSSPWPALTQMSGDLVIDRSALEIRNARARLAGVDLAAVRGGIATMHADPVLRLEGSSRGGLAEMLRVVDSTPVAAWTGGALHDASATGDAELRLELALPLADLGASTVRGSVALAGNDVRLSPHTPLLASARGRVEFTHQGFAIRGAVAQVFGGDASFEGGSLPEGGLRFTGAGTATADALRRQTVWPPLARAAGVLQGQTGYAVTLDFVRGRPQVAVTSSLVGMAIDLPAPLGKRADEPRALLYQTSRPADVQEVGQGPRELLRLDVGDVVRAQYLREPRDDDTRVLRGGIGVLEPPPWPAEGVAAAVSVPRLNVDEWLARAGSLPDGDGAALADNAYLPTRIALRAEEFVAASRRLAAVTAGITREDESWRATVDAEQLAGFVEYRPEKAGAAGRVYARLARLVLPKGEEEQVESLLDARPSTVPALDIVVDDFVLRDKKLGRLEIEAVNRDRPSDRSHEWRLSKLNLITPEARFEATGRWADSPTAGGSDPRRRAEMDFRLALVDSGALLERLGSGQAIRGGKGELSGQVGWLGSPLVPDYPSMTGRMAVAIESGQFLKAEPGAARLLGVLSLQSLPRRLALDFRDLFQEGFAFDSITGDVAIDQGVAHTNNLRMRGLQAAVLMEGNADLALETADLRVLVVPEIDAGTASLAYAAINPAVGLGTFLAQLLLRRPLIAANTREFHVSGRWDDPKVERIERKPEDIPATAGGGAGEAPTPPQGAAR